MTVSNRNKDYISMPFILYFIRYYTWVAIIGAMIFVIVLSESLSMYGIGIPPHETILVILFYGGFLTFSISILSAYIIFLATSPTRYENLITVLVGLIFSIPLLMIRKTQAPVADIILSSSVGLGLSSIACLGKKTFQKRWDEPNTIYPFLFVIGLPIFIIVMNYGHQILIYLSPLTYDNFLYAFDDALGGQLSFAFGRILNRVQFISTLCKIFYIIMPIAIAYIYALNLQSGKKSSVNIIKVFLATGIIGYFLYYLFPAAGPIYMFDKDFPYLSFPAQELPLQPKALGMAARNAMPSLHMAWALLIWWNSQSYKLSTRIGAGLFLVMTFLATLGLGEHYLIDLVVAYPFAVAMQAACTISLPLSAKERYQPIINGCGLTIIWLLLLRYCIPMFRLSIVIPWTFIILTIGFSFILKRRLQNKLNAIFI